MVINVITSVDIFVLDVNANIITDVTYAGASGAAM